MSLQAKWLPLERGVDFYIEMLKRLGSEPRPGHSLELGPPPLGSSKKHSKSTSFLERFYLVLCFQNGAKKEPTSTKNVDVSGSAFGIVF